MENKTVVKIRLIIVTCRRKYKSNLSRVDTRVFDKQMLIYIVERGLNKKVTIHKPKNPVDNLYMKSLHFTVCPVRTLWMRVRLRINMATE